MANRFDTIVIGLGAVGSAAVYQLAKKSSRVLGIDQFSPPHRQGSSHGDTRITRQAIGEGAEFVPFALRSYEIWDEIEKATGRKVLTITGGLIMTSAEQSLRHGSNFFKQTVASAEQNNIPHHLLDASQIRKRFPQFKLQGNEKGYFEEKAGFLRPERCIEAQLELARRHGAKIAVNEKVISLTPAKDEVTIKTNKGVYIGAKAVIASGSWVSHWIGERFKRLFRVFRQVLYWFEASGSIRQFELPNFPVWIWEFGTNVEDLMYGFPAIDGAGGGVKIAAEQYSTTTNPDIVSREVSAQEIQNMYGKYVQPHIAGLSKTCVKAEACLYTVTPDHKFVLDVHPDYSNIIVASPCSGHGFKHSAAIGETIAELAVEGKSKLDIRKFNFARFIDY